MSRGEAQWQSRSNLRKLVFEVRCRSVLGRGRKRDMRQLPLENGIGGRPVRVPTVQPRL